MKYINRIEIDSKFSNMKIVLLICEIDYYLRLVIYFEGNKKMYIDFLLEIY